jgi:hypothetical protein
MATTAMAPPSQAALLLLGSYTNDDVLPHFPLARPEWGVGITLASFVDGRIVPRGVVPVLNPAFQKWVWASSFVSSKSFCGTLVLFASANENAPLERRARRTAAYASSRGCS